MLCLQDRDTLLVLKLQVKAITDQELLLRVEAILVHLKSRAIPGLGLHLDNDALEWHVLLTRVMAVEHPLKGMKDTHNSSMDMVVQLLPHQNVQRSV